MYQIKEMHDPRVASKVLAEVESIEAAREWIETNYVAENGWDLVAFDRDADGHDAADAALVNPAGTQMVVLAIETA